MKTFRFTWGLLVGLASASAQPYYTLTDLGSLPGFNFSAATALNSSGQVAGFAVSSDWTRMRAFLWSAGTMTDLGALPGGAFSLATGLNSAAQVVGLAEVNQSTHAFRYFGGQLADLGTLGGNTSNAAAINDSGVVVGFSNLVTNGYAHAFVYANGQMTDLGTLGGASSAARSINAAGQIVGVAETGLEFNDQRAFLYAAGRMIDLGTLGGGVSWANCVNASGRVVGGSYVSSAGSPVPLYGAHAFLYADGRMADLGTLPPFDSSEPRSINASGQIVGEIYDSSYGNSFIDAADSSMRAFVYQDGHMSNLNALLVGSPGWILLSAVANNDRGQIAGLARNPAGDVRAVLLEPSADPVAPRLLEQPVSQNLAVAAKASFRVTAVGVGLNYQWRKNGDAILGATTAEYAIARVSLADMGFYSVVVTGSGGVAESTVAILTLDALPSYAFTTWAGTSGTRGNQDGVGAVAQFCEPTGLAVDAAGNVYVADCGNHTIRKIAANGTVSTLAGSAEGRAGSSDGLGGAAAFNQPRAVAVDRNGNVYVADFGGNTVRKITPAGLVTTLAGLASGYPGSVDGFASAARFHGPSGVAVDASGSVYVADSLNCTIRKITAAGVVTTLAGKAGSAGAVDGTGGDARFSFPEGVAVDAKGDVVVADTVSQTIRRISSAGVVTTVAGLAGVSGARDATGADARFNYPAAIALDDGGNLFVADRTNNLLRRVSAAGLVSTVAGGADHAGSTDGSAALFWAPCGIAVCGGHELVVADRNNHAIRRGAPVSAAPGETSRLRNLSARGMVSAQSDLTVGFVIRGDRAKPLLARAVGPTLVRFGVERALADPRLEVFPAGQSAASNFSDDWGGSAALADAFAGVGAFALAANSKDAAILAALSPAGYTARISSAVPSETGVALAELYDREATVAPGRLVNVSAQGLAGNGVQSLTAGFVIEGPAAKQLLIRVVGPGLAPFGVGGWLSDPRLSIVPLGKSFTVATNDNWDGSAATAAAFVQAGAFALAVGSRDAAVVVRLPPGGYTVVVAGANDAPGKALVEVYDLDP